jgi:hypothetical protein
MDSHAQRVAMPSTQREDRERLGQLLRRAFPLHEDGSLSDMFRAIRDRPSARLLG